MAEQPEEGWYRDPADPSRRRWWDGAEWSSIVAPPVTTPAVPVTRPTMADGTTLPYASDQPAAVDGRAKPDPDDDGEAVAGSSRVRLLLVLVALAALVATGAVVFTGRGDEPAGPVDVPVTTAPPTASDATESTTTTEPATTTTAPTTAEPAADDLSDAPAVEAPSYRDAYDACQVILDGSSIGDGGMDYQTFRDIDADTVGTVTELRFEATDADGDTEAYLCRTLFDGNGDVMVGRLYLDLQNVLADG